MNTFDVSPPINSTSTLAGAAVSYPIDSDVLARVHVAWPLSKEAPDRNSKGLRTCLVGWSLAAFVGIAATPVHAVGPDGLKPPSLDPRDLSGVWWSRSDEHAGAVDEKNNFTSVGRKIYAATAAGLGSGDLDDPVRSRCVLPGAVRVMFAPYPIQILQIRGEVIILPEGWHAYREVFMDTAHTGSDDINPSFMGESVGHWAGDTLVVDTVGIKDRVWLNDLGLPHSDQLQVIERFRKLAGGKQLEDRITITDPKIYRHPWAVRQIYEWRPDVRLTDYVCGDRNRDTVGARQLPKLLPPVATRPQQTAAPAGAPDLTGMWNHKRRGLGAVGLTGPGGEYRYAFSTTADGKPPPMQPWAEATFERYMHAIAIGHPIPTMATRCTALGLPAFLSQPYPYRIVQTAEYLLMLAEADHQFRIVYMTTTHPKAVSASWYGDSIGHWDGDTLEIETVGQNDRTLLSPGGIPKTEALVLTEHLHLTDSGQVLEDRIAVDDPGTFTAPWEALWQLDRMGPADRLDEYVCAENERDMARSGAGRAAAPH